MTRINFTSYFKSFKWNSYNEETANKKIDIVYPKKKIVILYPFLKTKQMLLLLSPSPFFLFLIMYIGILGVELRTPP